MSHEPDAKQGSDDVAAGKEPGGSSSGSRASGASEARPARGRGGSAPAVAALRMESVSLWVVQRVEAFPRSHRFTIGDRWIETCLDAQTSLVEASYVRDKRGLLLGASRALVRGRVLARMAAALRAISLDQEAHFARESGEIGRMIGGWLRALRGSDARAASKNVGVAGTP